MKLQCIRLSNFQCFGPEPTELSFESLTFLIGPNGSGKTAAMQALCRLFAFDSAVEHLAEYADNLSEIRLVSTKLAQSENEGEKKQIA